MPADEQALICISLFSSSPGSTLPIGLLCISSSDIRYCASVPADGTQNTGTAASREPLAVTTMKLFILTISLLFGALYASGQHISDTTVTKKYIDSLKRELAELKERNSFLYWAYQEKTNVSSIDTVFIRPDSSIITYSLKDGKPLKRQFNIIDKNNDLVRYTIYYYDSKQQVKYIEDWQTLKDDYFDGKLSSSERLDYDSLGRQTLSVKYLQSVRRTIRTAFRYDPNGKKQTKTDIIKSYALWDE